MPKATHERLTGEVNALRANALDALLTNAQQAERELRRLSGLLATIKSFDTSRYDAAVTAVAVAEQRRAEAREELFSEDELPGQPDDEWQRFVAAGDTYRRHLGQDEYPQNGDACLYCMHPLSPTAIYLLTRYRTFLDETLVQQLTTSQTALTAARLVLNESELSRAKEYVTDLALEDEAPDWATAVAKILVDATTVTTETAEGQALSVTGVPTESRQRSLGGRRSRLTPRRHASNNSSPTRTTRRPRSLPSRRSSPSSPPASSSRRTWQRRRSTSAGRSGHSSWRSCRARSPAVQPAARDPSSPSWQAKTW